MKHTFIRRRGFNVLFVSSCVIAFTFATPAASAENFLRLAESSANDSGESGKGKDKAKLKDKQKQKQKQKAKSSGKSQKQQTQKAQKSESGVIMKASGGKTCPPGQRPLGGARRGGCS